MSHDRLENWTAILAVAGGAALLVLAFMETAKRDVVNWGPDTQFEIEDGEPGEWVTAEIPVVKVRDCVLFADGGRAGPVIYYADKAISQTMKWERNGPPLKAKNGVWQRGSIRFRIPVDAKPGKASMVFQASFRCTLATVRQQSPAASFTIKSSG